MNKQIVTLQGKSYDAVTGSLISDVAPQQSLVKNPRPTQTSPAKSSKPRSTAQHVRHHAAQTPKTLMRHAVKKPGDSLRKKAKTHSALAHTHPQQIAVKHSVTQLDTSRQERATAVQRHPNVGRFTVPSSVSFVLADVPVRQAPDARPTNTPPTTPPPKQTNKPSDIFENAIESASHFVDIASNRASYKKRARRHVLSMAAGTCALLIIGGFTLYQNSPSLQLRVAGYRAGVATVTPNFASSGFEYTGSKVQGARVVIGLTADGTQYQLSQQETNWSGEEMIRTAASTDASGQGNYATLDIDGTTVYRLTGTQATWVANGIWYQVYGSHVLSDAQLEALVKNT